VGRVLGFRVIVVSPDQHNLIVSYYQRTSNTLVISVSNLYISTYCAVVPKFDTIHSVMTRKKNANKAQNLITSKRWGHDPYRTIIILVRDSFTVWSTSPGRIPFFLSWAIHLGIKYTSGRSSFYAEFPLKEFPFIPVPCRRITESTRAQRSKWMKRLNEKRWGKRI